MSNWDILREYINKKNVGDIITRKELRKIFPWMKNKRHLYTLDNYRNLITRCFFIKIVRRGVYEKLEDIPNDLTLNGLRSNAYWLNNIINKRGTID